MKQWHMHIDRTGDTWIMDSNDKNRAAICRMLPPQGKTTDSDGNEVDYTQDNLNNARMIKACPDMYEALNAIIPDLERYVRTHGPGPDRRLEQVKQALARAEGR